MNSPNIRFTSTALPEGKRGVLKMDNEGYYLTCVGALNSYNSQSHLYVLEGARRLIEDQSSAFMRRVKKGVVYAELGHPKKQPGMTEDDYLRRMLEIDEKSTCGHFRDFYLDFDSNASSRGQNTVLIMGWVRPQGVHSAVLKDDLENNRLNTCFSIRAFTQDKMVNGVRHRMLDEIVTFDRVTEPGIEFATKYNTPGLEGFGDLTNHSFNGSVISRVLSQTGSCVATESSKELLRGALTHSQSTAGWSSNKAGILGRW